MGRNPSRNSSHLLIWRVAVYHSGNLWPNWLHWLKLQDYKVYKHRITNTEKNEIQLKLIKIVHKGIFHVEMTENNKIHGLLQNHKIMKN